MSFEPLRHILTRSVVNASRSNDLHIARVFDIATRVVTAVWGEEKAAFVKPLSFKEGTLKFETTSPAAKQQFTQDATRLMNEMNRLLGSQIIRSLNVQSRGF